MWWQTDSCVNLFNKSPYQVTTFSSIIRHQTLCWCQFLFLCLHTSHINDPGRSFPAKRKMKAYLSISKALFDLLKTNYLVEPNTICYYPTHAFKLCRIYAIKILNFSGCHGTLSCILKSSVLRSKSVTNDYGRLKSE